MRSKKGQSGIVNWHIRVQLLILSGSTNQAGRDGACGDDVERDVKILRQVADYPPNETGSGDDNSVQPLRELLAFEVLHTVH